MTMRLRPFALLGLLSIGLISAIYIPPTQALAADKPLVIFAAASLKNALDDAALQWQASGHPKPVISYAASGPLAKQIESGAPADVFLSADLDWMDYLAKKALIVDKTRLTLLGNKLVLVVPKSSTATLTLAPNAPLADLIGDSRLAIGEPQSVPAGKYGKTALEKLGLWTSVSTKLAMSDNVRSALVLVARGEAAAGIVYQTDAAAEPGVKVIASFPADSHPPILYPVAQVTGSANTDVPEFLTFLKSQPARGAFERQGFDVIAGPPIN